MKTARKKRSTARPRRGRRWQLQEAKNKLSELIRLAREQGPQTITVHGKDAVVVTAAEAAAQRPGKSLVDLINESPLKGVDLKITRSTETSRPISLGDEEDEA